MMTPPEALQRIRFLEESAQGTSAVHRLSPLVKLVMTGVFILCVVSTGKYALAELVPYLIYPLLLHKESALPARPMAPWLLAPMPLLLGMGILNPLLDPRQVWVTPTLALSAGWISLAVLLGKGLLTAASVVLLAATTPLPQLSLGLLRLGIPKPLVLQLMMTVRYLSVLLEEGRRLMDAWRLRAPGQNGLSAAVWGPLMGQWLMRSMDRALRIYQAMKLQGFNGTYPAPPLPRLTSSEVGVGLRWVLVLLMIRVANPTHILGTLLLGGF